jgi:hypothetical protein
LTEDIEHDLTVDLDMREYDRAGSVQALSGDRKALQDRHCLKGLRF